MSVIAFPIIAQSCMACTLPHNVSTNLQPYEDNEPTILSEPTFQRTRVYQTAVSNIYPFTVPHVIPYPSKCQPRLKFKNRRTKKTGNHTRKYHNIIQRGGADCSQRR